MKQATQMHKSTLSKKHFHTCTLQNLLRFWQEHFSLLLHHDGLIIMY